MHQVAGTILASGVSVRSVDREIFGEIVAVCNGRLTAAERSGHHELAITRIGPTF